MSLYQRGKSADEAAVREQHEAAEEDGGSEHLSLIVSKADEAHGSGDDEEPTIRGGAAVGTRPIAAATLLLLLTSHLLVLGHRVLHRHDTEAIVTTWRVNTKSSRAKVSLKPKKDARALGYLEPDQVVEVYGEGTKFYHLAVSPITGFVRKRGLKGGNELLVELGDGEDGNGSALVVCQGWWPMGKSPARYMYAPAAFVVAQQLWNGMQVLHLYLIICLCFHRFGGTPQEKKVVGSRDRLLAVATASLVIVTVALLPFAIYITSPGGHAFAVVVLLASLVGIAARKDELKLTMEETDPRSLFRLNCTVNDSAERAATPAAAWGLAREETLAFACNMCSSLYNYNASRSLFPRWDAGFREVDRYLGLVGGAGGSRMDCTAGAVEVLYAMKRRTDASGAVTMPLFVARSTGSTAGSFAFALLWTVIPFLYVTYFGCMYVMSRRSPRPRAQRLFALFGCFHFLFMTDAVAYKYGRGFWTPHSELFHWFERFAWRIAILLPIYQNCTSKHWKLGHDKPVVGKAFHCFMAVWGSAFFLNQVVASDVIKFAQYLTGREQKDAMSMVGLHRFRVFSYHGGLVVSWLAYGFVLVGGFSHYYIIVQPNCESPRASAHRTFYRPKMALKAIFLATVLLIACLGNTRSWRNDHT